MPPKNLGAAEFKFRAAEFFQSPHRSVPLKRAGSKTKRPGSPTL